MEKSTIKIKRNDLRETVTWLVDNDPQATLVILTIVKRLLGEPVSQDEVLREVMSLMSTRLELFDRTIKRVEDFDAELARLAQGIQELTNEREKMADSIQLHNDHISSRFSAAETRCELRLGEEKKKLDQAFDKLGVHINKLIRESFDALDTLRKDIHAQALKTLAYWSIILTFLVITILSFGGYYAYHRFNSFEKQIYKNQHTIDDNQRFYYYQLKEPSKKK